MAVFYSRDIIISQPHLAQNQLGTKDNKMNNVSISCFYFTPMNKNKTMWYIRYMYIYWIEKVHLVLQHNNL